MVEEDVLGCPSQDLIAWCKQSFSIGDGHEGMAELGYHRLEFHERNPLLALACLPYPNAEQFKQCVPLQLLQPYRLLQAIKSEPQDVLVQQPHCLEFFSVS